MRSAPRALVLLVLMLSAACGDGEARPVDAGRGAAPIAEHAEVGGRVISTVDGAPITVDEVEEVAREAGLDPLVALRRLQEERVLAARAESAGLGDDAEVRDAARRAAVRALLAERVEREVGPDDVPEAEIAARYERERARFARPERRRVTHVLARVPAGAPPEVEAAAQRFARGAVERLAAAADPVAEARAIRQETQGRSFEVVAEDLPAISRVDPIAREFLDAAFSLPGPGVVPAPIRSAFGWHALVVVDVMPPWEAPREEAEDALRAEILAELRARRVDEIVGELAARTPVVREAAALDAVPAGGEPAGEAAP